MCGRYSLSSTPQVIGSQFGAHVDSTLTPRYNIAPGTDVLAIRADAESGSRIAELMHWGFTPSWAKPGQSAARPINARAEDIEAKPMFRNAMRHRRCILPADGFYEWKVIPSGKQPWFVAPANGSLFGLAGIYERRRDDEGVHTSCAILTTEANSLMKSIHDRMPAILSAPDYARWLDPSVAHAAELRDLLRPLAADAMRAWPVDTRVNNVTNDDPGLVVPVREAG